ncbi:MBL fold metallo-hydrolase [Mucilaginibacter celer]|uniref:MBL fold metallo-hydrolase n=1 Tax=Mucilaginibacter celer TaxID=2305508 RepID=A0A494VRL4_9SPHI|nr:MBL fold metallo-hydrolase [Mucilaginibacter celer]AYL98257.1 MBL fold metallo-hydrolase [Mucilaginibacter celer]
MEYQPKHQISRRGFIGSAGLLAAGLCISPKWVLAQQSPVITITNAAKTAKITIIKLRGNISMLEGSGGNIAVLNGPEGKLLVDAGIGVSKPNILNALNSISNKPIKYLVNSHWHFDHAGGNEWLHKAGATIIAQDITRKHLEKTTRVDDWNYTFSPPPAAALPTVLYKTEHTHHFNGEKITIKAYPPAHTDGDSSIFFPNANILHMADTFWNGYYPFIDYSTGGNIAGMIRAAQMNIDKTTKETIVIPGHGPVGNQQQLIEFHDMLVTIHAKIANMKKQGKLLNEVLAAKPTAAYDAKFGGFAIDGNFFTRLVYKGV